MSDDGELAIVVIALVGNPFSPSYARARIRGRGVAAAHAALNVAVYGRRGSLWSLRERVLGAGDRRGDGIAFGRSTFGWDHGALVVRLDERTTPFARPIRGKIVLHPEARCGLTVPLDRAGAHRWSPVAPVARIEVDLAEPGISFRGHGYHDANAGDLPLEATFDQWCWSRARVEEAALLTYAVREADGSESSCAIEITKGGEVTTLEAPLPAPLPRTRWTLDRQLPADAGVVPRIVRSLEDGPFYARALVASRLAGRPIAAVHEVLSASRLRKGWVRFLAGFRIGRAT